MPVDSSNPPSAALQTAYWGGSAADRNKGPILEVLRGVLPPRGLVLEVASGVGAHVVHFAAELGATTWQPSEPHGELRAAIAAVVGEAGVTNVRAPVDLDVLKQPWPVSGADAVVNINMIHIAPWAAAAALMQGSAALLDHGGVLFLYGPFRRFGAHTAASNEAFDARLRAQNEHWGLRDMEDVERLAGKAGFVLERRVSMPANNFSLVFRRQKRETDAVDKAVRGG